MKAMPEVKLETSAAPSTLQLADTGAGRCTLRVSNPSESLAFFVRARLLEESATLRTFYSDNYVALLPGETKTLEVVVEAREPKALPTTLTFEISGWNSPKQTEVIGTSIPGRVSAGR
jgi:hypothetical protein